jgi:hypothetical protein
MMACQHSVAHKQKQYYKALWCEIDGAMHSLEEKLGLQTGEVPPAEAQQQHTHDTFEYNMFVL